MNGDFVAVKDSMRVDTAGAPGFSGVGHDP